MHVVAGVAPLLTVIETGELVALEPAESVTVAVIVCAPFERDEVLREKDQLLVPLAAEGEPLSTATWTEEMLTLSEALPETVIVPETVAPPAGDEMEMAGDGDEEILTPKFAEAELFVESFTCTVKLNVPAKDGVPEIIPEELSDKPFGSVPAAIVQVYGVAPPLAESAAE